MIIRTTIKPAKKPTPAPITQAFGFLRIIDVIITLRISIELIRITAMDTISKILSISLK